MALWTKDTPSMTSAKYISQSFFSSNSNPGYSGFALWRDWALRSPEIAIAHLSQGLRSSYHGERGSFEFLSLQYAWQSWCPVNIEVWGTLGVVLPPGLSGRDKELVTCHQISYHTTLSASNGWQLHLRSSPPWRNRDLPDMFTLFYPDSTQLVLTNKCIFEWICSSAEC